jgi:hypothetical protein
MEPTRIPASMNEDDVFTMHMSMRQMVIVLAGRSKPVTYNGLLLLDLFQRACACVYESGRHEIR